MYKKLEDIKCPHCGNQEKLEWQEDQDYFVAKSKGYELKRVVACPNCLRDFAVFSEYEKTRRDIKRYKDLQTLGETGIFKLVKIDVCMKAD